MTAASRTKNEVGKSKQMTHSLQPQEAKGKRRRYANLRLMSDRDKSLKWVNMRWQCYWWITKWNFQFYILQNVDLSAKIYDVKNPAKDSGHRTWSIWIVCYPKQRRFTKRVERLFFHSIGFNRWWTGKLRDRTSFCTERRTGHGKMYWWNRFRCVWFSCV